MAASRGIRARVISLFAGVALAAACIAGIELLLPQQSACDPKANYSYVYSGAKSQSTAFAKATMGDDSMLVFGSSELSTSKRIIPEVPAAIFGEHDYGLQLYYVGEAYDQSLWHAMALGAYDQAGAAGSKVVIIVAPGWFEDGGEDSTTFQTRFSYALYKQFCENSSISPETKSYVRGRLLGCGISETTLDAASGSMPQDALNSLAFSAIEDLGTRRSLVDARKQGIALVSGTAADKDAPDFEALRAQAAADGAAASSSNSWGVEDSFYTEKIEPVLDAAEGARASETYTDTPEYDDLSCFLDICSECGIEPLVVISPVLGPYYDHIGITSDKREACYSRIRSVCSSHGAQVADFSDKEYEPCFLYDIVHFGWTGWVDVEESAYAFAKGA